MPGSSPVPEASSDDQTDPSPSAIISPTANQAQDPSSPSATQPEPTYQRPSIRWDAAQRACRDGDLKTLQYLISHAQIFESPSTLRAACLSGSWGAGEASTSSPSPSYSTQDSIRLHTLLQTATTRNHVDVVKYLLSQFPAKGLHVLEWEIIVNAIAQASTPLLEAFYAVDPQIIQFFRPETGNIVMCLFDVVPDEEMHGPVVRWLLQKGAQPDFGFGEGAGGREEVLMAARQRSSGEVVGILEDWFATR